MDKRKKIVIAIVIILITTIIMGTVYYFTIYKKQKTDVIKEVESVLNVEDNSITLDAQDDPIGNEQQDNIKNDTISKDDTIESSNSNIIENTGSTEIDTNLLDTIEEPEKVVNDNIPNDLQNLKIQESLDKDKQLREILNNLK